MKKSFGSVPKTRLKRLFEALLAFAVEEKRGILHLKYGNQVILRYGQLSNQIYVRTSSSALAGLTNQYETFQKKGINEPLESWHVAETLKHLETTLGILIDCRRKRQGATERYFRLELWHPFSEIQFNLDEVNRRWPNSRSTFPNESSDLSLTPFTRNKRLLKLIHEATQPITWQQFANAIGLSENNEHQSKALLAETCILLLENPPSEWLQYLYRFSPLHILDGGAGTQLLSLLPKNLALQRSTIDLILDRIIHIQTWPIGETNSFLIQLAHSDEWFGINILTEIAWKLLDSSETQLATQIVMLLSDKQLYKSQAQKLLEIKQAVLSRQYAKVLLSAGEILKNKGLPPSFKSKVNSLIIQSLINSDKHHLAWKVCEKAMKNVSPETDLDDWLTFQFILTQLDIFFDRTDCAWARLVGLEKIVMAQQCKSFQPLILQLKGEYYQSVKDYSQAKFSFNESLAQYQTLRHFLRIQDVEEKLSE
jgi:Effector-associated domain 4